jgi:hypothetical protein
MKPWIKFLLFAGGACVVYVMVTSGPSKIAKPVPKPPPTPGWMQIDACSPMQSFDGTKEITFREDHTVELLERDSNSQRVLAPSKVAGAWAFDEAARRYFVTLSQQQKSYALVQPENSEVCILLYGELAAANIGESWFAKTAQELQEEFDDRDPPDRY